ncbi:hypothetical protein FI667_g13719, partial [Globisporangium splendens]
MARYSPLQYLVQWYALRREDRTETWESEKTLWADGYGYLLAIVDRWVQAGRVEPFATAFKRWDKSRRIQMKDNKTGMCALVAVQTLMAKLGVQRSVIINEFNTFKEEQGIGEDEGLRWEALHQFLGRAVGQEWWLDFPVLKFNLCRGHLSRTEAFIALHLVDGLYIVGTSSSLLVGHCWVLEVAVICVGKGKPVPRWKKQA